MPPTQTLSHIFIKKTRGFLKIKFAKFFKSILTGVSLYYKI